MKYEVILKKYEIYEVEAADCFEAEDKACALCDADRYAWKGPADEIETQEIE